MQLRSANSLMQLLQIEQTNRDDQIQDVKGMNHEHLGLQPSTPRDAESRIGSFLAFDLQATSSVHHCHAMPKAPDRSRKLCGFQRSLAHQKWIRVRWHP